VDSLLWFYAIFLGLLMFGWLIIISQVGSGTVSMINDSSALVWLIDD
jgi:hypothetical protein